MFVEIKYFLNYIFNVIIKDGVLLLLLLLSLLLLLLLLFEEARVGTSVVAQ